MFSKHPDFVYSMDELLRILGKLRQKEKISALVNKIVSVTDLEDSKNKDQQQKMLFFTIVWLLFMKLSIFC